MWPQAKPMRGSVSGGWGRKSLGLVMLLNICGKAVCCCCLNGRKRKGGEGRRLGEVILIQVNRGLH